MSILLYIYIFILWLLFWSFTSVLISRIKNKKSWIVSWRSECPNCNHKLWIKDLFPLFSFLFSKGKCRYCHKKISFLYPILEISMWILFFLTAYFLVDINLVIWGNLLEIWKLIFFLLFSFLTIVYVFYDILYLEIPDSILWVLIFLTLGASLIQAFFWYEIITIWDYSYLPDIKENILLSWSLIVFIISFYFIMLSWLKELYDIIIIFFLIVILWILKYYFLIDLTQSFLWSLILSTFLSFMFFFLQILLSWWKWMWWWDLRIAILLWLLLWYSYYFYGILISYITWASIWIFVLIYKKTREYYKLRKNYIWKIKKILWLRPTKIEVDTQIPFWPFLAVWIYVILFYWEKIVDFINDLYL